VIISGHLSHDRYIGILPGALQDSLHLGERREVPGAVDQVHHRPAGPGYPRPAHGLGLAGGLHDIADIVDIHWPSLDQPGNIGPGDNGLHGFDVDPDRACEESRRPDVLEGLGLVVHGGSHHILLGFIGLYSAAKRRESNTE